MDERGNSMTDASPLVKIKQALKSLKSEISQMDLRIGVVSEWHGLCYLMTTFLDLVELSCDMLYSHFFSFT